MSTACTEERDDACRLELPEDLQAVGLARQITRELVRRWGVFGVLEPLTLVVSELVGNAVRHGRPPFELHIRRLGRGVRVDVHDAEQQNWPAPTNHDAIPRADQQSGRGLFIVTALSARFGVDIHGDGKRVWAVVEEQTAN